MRSAVRLACATGAAAALVATAARVRTVSSLSTARGAWDFAAVLAEEARIEQLGDIDQNDTADVMRHLFLKHPEERASGDLTQLAMAVESVLNVPRSSPEKKMLTCDQGTLLMWVLTKWSLDAALKSTTSTFNFVNLLLCQGAAKQDRTCRALKTIAEKCPERADIEDLKEERAHIFERYMADHEDALEVAMAAREANEIVDTDTEGSSLSARRVAEALKSGEAEAFGDIVSQAQNEANEEKQQKPTLQPNRTSDPQLRSWFEACGDGERVHASKNGPEDKCMPPPRQSRNKECPADTTTYCYHAARRSRCCCPEDLIHTDRNYRLTLKKYGTKGCAAHMHSLELQVRQRRDD